MKSIKIFSVIRNILAFAALVMLILAFAANTIEIFFILLTIFTISAILCDIIVIVLHRKNGIELKKHENYFKFKKRK